MRPHRRQSPGSPVPGILQARTLEWVAISFFSASKWKVKVKSLSRVRPSATPWTAAYQAPPSMGFSRQECWSGVPLPSPPECPQGSEIHTWRAGMADDSDILAYWYGRKYSISQKLQMYLVTIRISGHSTSKHVLTIKCFLYRQSPVEKKWKFLNLYNRIHLLPWLKTRAQRSLYSLSEKKKQKQNRRKTRLLL